MKFYGKTDWIHLIMFSMIAALGGGWLIYYIDEPSRDDTEPRYYLYKAVRNETKDAMPLSDPATGYGKITVKGKITGSDAMTASLNNYFGIDEQYWRDYAGKFVEATGYLARIENVMPGQNPFRFDIQSIAPAAENEIDDAGKACASSLDCRNQCVIEKTDNQEQCGLNVEVGGDCAALAGKCSATDLSKEENINFIILD